MRKMKLQQFLQLNTSLSRRKAGELIKEARVKVNNRTVKTPWQEIDPGTDSVSIDGNQVMSVGRKRLTVLLNKPAGYITAMFDDRGRPTVGDIVKERFSTELFHVGRLDKDTEGLLLMTNDGQLAQDIAHPSSSVEKTYLVEVRGVLEDREIRSLSEGVVLRDGFRTSPARARIVEQKEGISVVEIVIREGHKRQVREMIVSLGRRVIRLTRTAIGRVTIELVPNPGDIKELTEEEIALLKKKKGTL